MAAYGNHWEPSTAQEEDAALQQAIQASLGQLSLQPQQQQQQQQQQRQLPAHAAAQLRAASGSHASTSAPRASMYPTIPPLHPMHSPPLAQPQYQRQLVPPPTQRPPPQQPQQYQPAPAPAAPLQPLQPARVQRRQWELPPAVAALLPSAVAPARPQAPAAAPPRQPLPPPPAGHHHHHHAAPAGHPAPPKAPRPLHPDPANCAQCGQGFGYGGQYLTALGRKWHSACFTCELCGTSINRDGNSQFATGRDDGRPYHLACFKAKYNPVCVICAQYIPELSGGRIEFKEHPFWREKYCPKHVSDGTLQCCSCQRFPHNGEEYVRLTDSREVCLQCLDTIVTDTHDAQPLYAEVLGFFRAMGMAHPEVAPFMLVDAPTLNEYSGREGKDISAPGAPVFHVRGLTLATVYGSIPSIVRSGARGGFGVSTMSNPIQRARCNVTAVLVMYGLPRLLTGSIIAHELTHAWLRMKGVTGLNLKTEEGLCQLMAYVWLDQQHGSLSQEPSSQRLASYFSYQVREDTSEIYGDGFREAFAAFQVHGLPAVVHSVSTTGRLPRA